MDISYTSEFDAKRYEAYIRRALGLKAETRREVGVYFSRRGAETRREVGVHFSCRGWSDD